MFEDNAHISLLQDKKILITRPENQAKAFAEKLSSLSAKPIILPAIKITPIKNTSHLEIAILNLSKYNWIIFTSSNAVTSFIEKALKLNVSPENIAKSTKIACVGPATAAILEENYKIKTDFIPEIHTAEELAESLPGDLKDKKILLPNAEIARPVLKDLLTAKGAEVDEITLYHTQPNIISKEELEKVFNNKGVDMVTFTSSSAVNAMAKLLENTNFDLNNYIIACIGPETAKTAEELGLHVAIIGNPHTTDGMISEMIKFFENKQKN